ncbi:hypothetical protein C8R46DRAFT_1199006 [Mycena filopes]|nr:hypothetical protein C8R46DRAFT_1199006 [Mycena filopes]
MAGLPVRGFFGYRDFSWKRGTTDWAKDKLATELLELMFTTTFDTPIPQSPNPQRISPGYPVHGTQLPRSATPDDRQWRLLPESANYESGVLPAGHRPPARVPRVLLHRLNTDLETPGVANFMIMERWGTDFQPPDKTKDKILIHTITGAGIPESTKTFSDQTRAVAVASTRQSMELSRKHTRLWLGLSCHEPYPHPLHSTDPAVKPAAVQLARCPVPSIEPKLNHGWNRLGSRVKIFQGHVILGQGQAKVREHAKQGDVSRRRVARHVDDQSFASQTVIQRKESLEGGYLPPF